MLLVNPITILESTPGTDTYCRVCRLRDTMVLAWLTTTLPFKSLKKLRNEFLTLHRRNWHEL